MKDEVLMPRELTAENGAKSLLSGEFFEEVEIQCHECADCESDDCYLCDGNGSYIYSQPISWENIKAIYKKAVEHIGVDI